MFDAIGLYHFRWRKKKVDGFIIPPSYFQNIIPAQPKPTVPIVAEIPTALPATEITPAPIPDIPETVASVDVVSEQVSPPAIPVPQPQQAGEVKVSALSIASIRAKRELEQSRSHLVKEDAQLPTKPFTETAMLLEWVKYAQRLGDKGQKIMESYMLINDPTLRGTTILHELPNEGSKIDFEMERHTLLGYLRSKLHNHNIELEVVVNETIEEKKLFSSQDRYNRLKEINPAIDLLRSTFGLDLAD